MNTVSKLAGFTLIEVLVSIGILAIGLLGLASLQGTSMKLGNSALLRSQAINLAYNIVDAMLANRNEALSGDYTCDLPKPVDAPECEKFLSLTGPIAQQDLQAWRNTLACTLPQGTGGIERNNDSTTFTANGATSFTVTVAWDDSRGTKERQTIVIVTDIGPPWSN